MLICSFASAKAETFTLNEQNSIQGESKAVYINEYQSLVEKKAAYEKKVIQRITLSENETEEYNQIVDSISNYPNYIYSLQNLSEDELKAKHYTDAQIDAIMNYDGSEEMTIRASAYVSATLTCNDFYYSSSDNRTYITATFSGKWVGDPMFRFQDTIGIGFVGSNAKFLQKSSPATVTFDNGISLTPTGQYDSAAGYKYKFGMQYNGSTCRRFTMTYTGQATGYVSIADYGAAYGHSSLAISGFGFSIGTDLTLGISFSLANNTSWEWKKVYTKDSFTR